MTIKFNFNYLFIFAIVFLFSCQDSTKSGVEYFDLEANAWHLEPWDENHWVLADYDGNVFLRKISTGENLWSYPVGAFVFDLKTGDLDGDGNKEVAVATASGELLVLDHQGKKSWSFNSPLALYNVGIGNFTGDSRLEVVCGGIDRRVYVFDHEGKPLATSGEMERLVHRIAIGNLSGGQYDEILVVENRTIAHLMSLSGGTLQTIWRKPLKVPEELINWENPRGNFFPFSIIIDDIDGDGDNEILMGDTFFNKQAVMVSDHEGEPLWISEGVPNFTDIDNYQTEFYSTAFVRTADVFPEIPGKEIIAVAGGYFRVWDHQGKLLGAANSKVGFTDFEVDGNTLFLSSCPNGDEFMYQLEMKEGWEASVAALDFQGPIKQIEENTNELKSLVEKFPVSEMEVEKPYRLIYGNSGIRTTPEGLADDQDRGEWFTRQFPYKNLQLIKAMKIIEPTPPLDEQGNPWSERRWRTDAIRGTMTVEEILQRAQWIEENKIPTLFVIGHSCMPFITLETAEKILQIAPNYTVGFATYEDESLELLSRYFEHFFKPLAELCKKYGNKLCMTKNKGLWWMSSPSNPEVFNAMFEDGRHQVTLAATEDSNSRTPEINLLGRGGLWQAGLLTQNDVSIHSDLFSFNRFHQWEYPRTGHPYLRLLIAHTTLGMTQTYVRTRRNMREREKEGSESLEESVEIFFHLLGKGIVFSPNPEDALGYSPLGMVVHQPSEKWLTDAHNGHSPEKWEDDTELHQAVFPHNGNLWGMTNTPEHAFQRVILNKERQFGYQMPATPYGLVAFVPEHANLEKVANISQWLHTDGIFVWKEEDKKYTGQEAATFLRKEFDRAAEKLLFRQIGEEAAFMQVLRVSEGHFRLFIVDPGWINPEVRNLRIQIQMEGTHEVEDLLYQKQYQVKNNQFEVEVPAGLFKILDVKKL